MSATLEIGVSLCEVSSLIFHRGPYYIRYSDITCDS